jgi:hypothetical protein
MELMSVISAMHMYEKGPLPVSKGTTEDGKGPVPRRPIDLILLVGWGSILYAGELRAVFFHAALWMLKKAHVLVVSVFFAPRRTSYLSY